MGNVQAIGAEHSVLEDESGTRAEIVHAHEAFAGRLREACEVFARAGAPEAEVADLRGMAGFCELIVAEEAEGFPQSAFHELSSLYLEVGNRLGELGRHDVAADGPGASALVAALCKSFTRAAELAELHVAFGRR